MKTRRILVSQPEPQNGKSPYIDLAERTSVTVDFRQFIKVEGIATREFRKSKVNMLDHTAVIFTSKTSIDHYFRVTEELRLSVPEDMKYFCANEATAYYLQKYIVYRKRKIFFGKRTLDDMFGEVVKHKNEKYLLPVSVNHKLDIPRKLKKLKINFTKAELYETVFCDLTDLQLTDYDILVFFSPQGIKSLFSNFPEFKQSETKIASFGPSTAKAVKDAGLRLDIKAPMPQVPSMSKALQIYLEKLAKKK